MTSTIIVLAKCMCEVYSEAMRYFQWILVPALLATQLFAQIKSPADRAREVLDLMLSGKTAELHALFNDRMKQALPLEALEQRLLPGIRQLGKLQSVGPPKETLTGDVTSITLPVDFEVAKLELFVAFEPSGKLSGLFLRPRQVPVAWAAPPYTKPDSFTERDLTVGSDEWKLPATLTLPKGDGPFRALVLVHGSGPNDRDETVGQSKPFKDLAWGLASRGIAVLRYEKRTRIHGSRMGADLTVKEETVEDAGRAVELLQSLPEIDPKRVYIAGHSLGGYLLPRLLARAPKPAGGIALAGSTRPLEDLIEEQTIYLASLQPPSDEVRQQVEKMRAAIARFRSLKPGETMEPLLGMPAPYLLNLRGYQPPVELRAFSGPIFIAWGERDYQVTRADYDGWVSGLRGLENASFKTYPALNHLFIPGSGKSNPGEYQQPGHVDSQLIDDLAKFILR